MGRQTHIPTYSPPIETERAAYESFDDGLITCVKSSRSMSGGSRPARIRPVPGREISPLLIRRSHRRTSTSQRSISTRGSSRSSRRSASSTTSASIKALTTAARSWKRPARESKQGLPRRRRQRPTPAGSSSPQLISRDSEGVPGSVCRTPERCGGHHCRGAPRNGNTRRATSCGVQRELLAHRRDDPIEDVGG